MGDLNLGYENGNIFAKILRGEIPCARVFEDARTLAFMDAFPQALGHTLVIPKTKAVNLFDLAPDDLRHLITETQTIARAVRAALEPEGVQIFQFNGSAAGQTVFHIHFHIVPRWHDMTLKTHAKGVMADMNALQATANLNRSRL